MNCNPQNAAPVACNAGQATTITLPDELARTAYEDKYIGLYWEAYLPNGRALPADQTRLVLGSWSSATRDLYAADDTLRKSVLAMSFATLSKREGEKWMSEKSLKYYIEALQETAVALKIPSKAKSDELLSATRLFSLYEVGSVC